MKKSFIAVLFAILSFSAIADELKGQCGDVAAVYITNRNGNQFDSNNAFAAEYLNKNALQALKDEGYKHILGGRNCYLENGLSLQIIIASAGKKPQELIDFGPLTIYGAKFQITGASEQDIYDGLVFTGDSKHSLTSSNGSAMSLQTGRGYGKVKVIIQYNDYNDRLKNNL